MGVICKVLLDYSELEKQEQWDYCDLLGKRDEDFVAVLAAFSL
jgi:hypothetical protein